MTITLGDLRVYGAEVAGKDLSSEKGDRLVQHWINGSLARICGSHMWSWYKRSERLTVLKAVTGFLLEVTDGSRDVRMVPAPIAIPPDPQLPEEVFLEEWLTEQWHFLISDDSRVTYELAEIVDPKFARFKKGHEWTRPSGTLIQYSVSRHIYDLPEPVKRVMLVEDTFNSTDLMEMLPTSFDKLRQTSPIYKGQPTHYTIRHGKLEVWPSASDDNRTMSISYHRAAPVYGLANVSDDSLVVDWDGNFTDLLFKAMLVEASLTQGKRAPVPYQVAMGEYMLRMGQCKQDDSNVTGISGTVESVSGQDRFQRTRVADYPNDLQTWRGS